MILSRLRKLHGRSPAELAGRARQGAGRWLERRGFGDTGEPEGERLAALAGAEPEDGVVIRGPFFAAFDDRDATLTALRSVDPGFETTLRARAERLLQGRYDLLGHRDLTFGDPVDWLLDPLAGVRSPALHWSEIDYLDPAVAGDHKLVWELGRHQALVTLGQAWWCTGDTRYASECERLITGWLDANPPKRGVHWASSLEVSFRAIAWIWVLALCGDVLPRPLRRRMLGHLAVAGRHIERNLSTWFSPNTHLTGEALGLFVLGTALPQCPRAARWRDRGRAILLGWIDRHVRVDGSYVEQSTWYHRYTTDFYLHFLVLSDRSSRPVRDTVEAPLGRLLEHLAWITRPDGTMPLIGDDDGGRLVFLDERTAHDTRAPLAIGAALLGRSDLAAVAAMPGTELVWLLGSEGLRAFREVNPAFPEEASRAFPDGGIHVVRSGWDASASIMTIDAGPHGYQNGGHAHADALSIDLTVNGYPVLVDPGTFTYTRFPEWRDRFRETASHNAAVVDGCGSASVSGEFRWLSRATARADAWYDGGGVVLFSGTHDGFERLRPAVHYRRVVAFVRPALWIVRDEIVAEGEHELAVHWQCAAGVEVENAAGALVLSAAGAERLVMRVAERDGSWSTLEGAVSPTYGLRQPAKHLRLVRRGVGPLCVTTVLCAGAPLRGVAEGAGIGGIRPVEVTWGDRRGLFSTKATNGPHWLDTDAAVTWVERVDQPRQVAVSAAALSRLVVSGDAVLRGDRELPGLTAVRSREKADSGE